MCLYSTSCTCVHKPTLLQPLDELPQLHGPLPEGAVLVMVGVLVGGVGVQAYDGAHSGVTCRSEEKKEVLVASSYQSKEQAEVGRMMPLRLKDTFGKDIKELNMVWQSQTREPFFRWSNCIIKLPSWQTYVEYCMYYSTQHVNMYEMVDLRYIFFLECSGFNSRTFRYQSF